MRAPTITDEHRCFAPGTPDDAAVEAIERLASAIRYRTVSEADGERHRGEFVRLHEFLAGAFPHVHRVLRRERVNGLSLLYTWEGSDPSLAPVLFSAHLDVVPVAAATERQWSVGAFDGRIADGYLWGRGALDDKPAVVGLLEAAERLLASGGAPARTVYFAFGHDEERGGMAGAARIAALLRDRGVRLGYTLDEGLVIGDRLIPGVARPVALIGVAEKGRVVLEIVARGAHGHASMPPARSAIGALARAIDRLESHPMPAAIRSPMRELFVRVAAEMPALRRLVFANPGLFAPLLTRVLARSRTTNAAIRTTMAPTVAAAGDKDNVLPGEARVRMDVRVLPGDTLADVLDHVRGTIADEAIEIRTLHAAEPSPLAPSDGPGFAALAGSVSRVFPDAIVAPGLLVAGTDGKHYAPISDAVYRFRPLRLTRDDVGRIHGVDERIGIADYGRLVTFYTDLLNGVSTAPTAERITACATA